MGNVSSIYQVQSIQCLC